MSTVHRPVLFREVSAQLALSPGLMVVDGTVGAGGHSREILPQIRPGGQLIGIDRDPMMLQFASQSVSGDDVHLCQGSYSELAELLIPMSLSTVDRVLLDLGLSSDQLADRERGFGFDAGGRLDLRFDVSQGRSAAEWLQQSSVQELTRIFQEFGEEPQAERIARGIAQHRAASPIETAEDLAAAVLKALGVSRSAKEKHPATRIFQALRIAVNQELEHLERFLDSVLPKVLNPGGRIAIITFHSLEDRLVKQAFRDTTRWNNLTKKPIEASPAEIRMNPRSRSARLRVAERLA
ncbi:MAG: 16S rRNA (cytosine(1402)-N(4))-methyltransferase RsmH [Planctomycetaceae bacterium]